MSKQTDTADALVVVLNAGTYAAAVTVTRAVLPKYALEAVQQLTTQLILGDRNTLAPTRGTFREYNYDLHLIVQAPLPHSDLTTLDLLQTVAQQLEEQILANPVVGNAQLIGVEALSPFDPGIAELANQLVLTITASYKELNT